MANWTQSFRETFCERMGCADADYPARIFRRTLYGHARPLAFGLRLLRPDHFTIDDELIEVAGNARSWDEFNQALESHAFNNKLRGGFLRRQLKLRVSGQKLSRIAVRLLGARSDRKPRSTAA